MTRALHHKARHADATAQTQNRYDARTGCLQRNVDADKEYVPLQSAKASEAELVSQRRQNTAAAARSAADTPRARVISDDRFKLKSNAVLSGRARATYQLKKARPARSA